MKSILYKKSKTGKIQQWTIETDGSSFRTIEGFIDGAQTPTEWTHCIGKRIGMANATTGVEQAEKEALAKIKKQKDKGWVENIEDVETTTLQISPMLTHKFPDYQDTILSQDIPLATQPKLDGIRCIATRDGLFTRNGKPIVAAPHVFSEVQKIFEGLEGIDLKLDGELYNHDLKEDFNKITSLVRKQKLSNDDLEQSAKYLQYHIYDIDIPGRTFANRFAALQMVSDIFASSTVLKIVPTTFFKHVSLEQKKYWLDTLYAEFLEQGYEGQMVRLADSHYENNRSKSLLKRKEFQDREFVIVDIEEGKGNRSGMMGRIKFEGFDANARGSHEFFRELLINKVHYVGKTATVRYQNLTPDGVPRFPVVIKIAREDYE